MSFPTDNDIQRVIDMQSSDCGFFVLAIYAFIEKYMKSEISYFGEMTILTLHLIHSHTSTLER